jgi:hypothetical protein
LISKKWGYAYRRNVQPGRPPVPADVKQLVVQFAKENPAWGYDRILGALVNLEHRLSGQTIGNILQEHGPGPTRERRRQIRRTEEHASSLCRR